MPISDELTNKGVRELIVLIIVAYVTALICYNRCRHSGRGEIVMFNRILLAGDGSPHSLRATDRAIEIVKKTPDAILTLIHVIDDLPVRSEVIETEIPGRTVPDHQKTPIKKIEEKAAQAHIPLNVKCVYGEPGPAIVREATTECYDLVVIGSRGLNHLQKMVLGSVSHKVAKRVPCPVLIVK
ncbi:universal stress protein [Salipaludibacillus sp. LMS25]|jgi:nucleotide-binding universal stress UspA family protein|uniref:universal stress protein n=1 Tax=Salipaludibacillus sp. LMS25 TaxID=2924031 RepID=UPI0020D0E2A5|nr:universal stress protein [Salipaludibacillus sp. LMS25]UTR14748.1 universal stress protein [Salipaludibacillus sp. LMS25]